MTEAQMKEMMTLNRAVSIGQEAVDRLNEIGWPNDVAVDVGGALLEAFERVKAAREAHSVARQEMIDALHAIGIDVANDHHTKIGGTLKELAGVMRPIPKRTKKPKTQTPVGE